MSSNSNSCNFSNSIIELSDDDSYEVVLPLRKKKRKNSL